MAYNPFLSMNEPAAPLAEEVLNPFMIADSEPLAFGGDNPFANSNPFSDLGGYEPAAGDTVPLDIFGGPNPPGGGARQFDGFAAEAPAPMDIFASLSPEAERLVKPTELELVSTTSGSYSMQSESTGSAAVPQETQNLILSVTGQMEFTSSHLLDRIPPTRTPSPVSVRDIHSPSPTPEPEHELPEDEPVAGPSATALTAPGDSFDINRNKPTRPPPARPPPAMRPPLPRPVPPPPPPAPAPTPAPAFPRHSPDDINLFDAPAPTVVKPTKEAILSLYTAPKKEEKQIDFLSDDILDDIPADIGGEVLHDMSAQSALEEASSPQKKLESAPMDCSEPPSESMAVSHGFSPFAGLANQDGHTSAAENNPFQNGGLHETVKPFTANVFGDRSDNESVAADTDTFGMMQSEAFSSLPAAGFPAPTGPGAGAGDAFDSLPVAGFAAPTGPFAGGAAAFEASPGAGTGDAFGSLPTAGFPAPTDPFAGGAAAFEASPGAGAGDTFDSLPTAGFPEPTDPFAGGAVAFETSPGAAGTEAMVQDAFPESQDAFDAFSAKFDSTSANRMNTGAWGDEGGAGGATAAAAGGFEAEVFDPFLDLGAPPAPAATPRLPRQGSRDSADDSFSVFIRPKESEGSSTGEEACVPALAPPPPPRAHPQPDTPLRPNPFDEAPAQPPHPHPDANYGFGGEERRRSGSGSGRETPPTPLFDEDVSQPLEDFPRTKYQGPGWEMHLRQPNKKKITGQRFWKKIFVRLAYQGDNPVVQLLNSAGDKEPFQELPLQACYSVSEVGAQQFDQFGKIFTVKLQYIFYKERPGVRPGQVTKAERITNKLSQFAAYAIQGDYQGVKEFGSDLRKLGLPVEHAPQVSQLFKLGSLVFEDVKQFSCCVEEALFRLPAHRDRALAYKMEEVQITAVDELYVEQDAEGSVLKQIARVRLFFLGFLSGMPDVELGVNDLRRQGREVVGRHDIIPVVTEEWIRVEDTEFHACVQPDQFASTQIIKFKPPDACYIELMRFRVRPPKNRELPLQLKAVWCVTGNKVELRADVLVPGFASRKLGQVPCEDVAIRFPIPECWIYLFRVEKHFRYGSVKSAHRRTGKIKGIERFLGAVDTPQESLIEVTSGQAKYEHQHRAIVWRMPRLPKEGQGAYTTHNLVSRMALTSYDQVPAELARHALVEFTMPATQVSHMTVRSVSLQHHDADPPEKYVRYLARHEYLVGIERTSGQAAPAYAIAASTEPRSEPAPAPAAPAPPQPPSSDSDSD